MGLKKTTGTGTWRPSALEWVEVFRPIFLILLFYSKYIKGKELYFLCRIKRTKITEKNVTLTLIFSTSKLLSVYFR